MSDIPTLHDPQIEEVPPRVEKERAQLSSSPLLNPNPVIETDLNGKVLSVNPSAQRLFPDIQQRGPDHPFIAGWENLRTARWEVEVVRREIMVGERWYYQTIQSLGERIRIYGLDVTDLKRIEVKLRADRDALVLMHALSGRPLSATELQPLLQEIMEAAAAIVRAEKGTLQLVSGGLLRIVAHYGHQPPFLEFFESAENRVSACGQAAGGWRRVVVPDIEASPLYAGTASLPVLRQAGVRAVQSTPILGRTGALLGILTTQWSVPHSPDEPDLWRFDLLVRQTADLIEAVRAEERLRGSEARLARSQEIAHLGSWELDLENDELTWSDEVYRIFGLQPQEFGATYEAFLERVHPEDRPRVDAAYSGSIREGKDTYEIEHRVIRTQTGEIRWVHEKCEHKRNAAGKIIRSIGMVLDITDRKRAESNQVLGNDILRVLNRGGGLQGKIAEVLRLIQQATQFTAVGLRLKQGNDWPYFEQRGFTDEFLREENFICGRDAHDQPALECTCGLVLSGRTDPAMACFTAHGSFWTNHSANLLGLEDDPRVNARNRCIHSGYKSVGLFPVMAGQGIIGLLQLNDHRDGMFTPELIAFYEGLAQNIGLALQRAMAEQSLQESESKLRLFIECAPAAIAMLDKDMKYLAASRRWFDDYHVTDRNIIGRSHYEVFPDLPAEWRAIHRRVLTGAVERREADSWVRGDGHTDWMRWEVRPWYKENNLIGGLIIFSENITDFKRAEATLAASEQRFRLLSQTADKLLRIQDPQSVINDLCREVMESLDCQAFFNFLVDEAAGRLRLNACGGIPEDEARKIEWLDFGTADCGCVDQNGNRIIAEDIQSMPDIRTDLVRSYGIQAYCCHPLKTHDRIIGTLSFGTRTRPRFTDTEIEVMRSVADLVAVAMQRMRAESWLRELNTTLELRVKERTAEATSLALQLRELASEVTMAEQRERQRMAKVLHDHIQQMLVAAKMQTSILVNRQPNEQLTASAKLVAELLDQTLSASRSLTAELSPPVLQDGGLGPALQWLARSFLDKHGLKVEISFDPSGEPLLEDMRSFLFDASREVLFNVVKHSGAERAQVQCYCGPDSRVRMIIADEGKGFDPSRLQTGEKPEGFGLFSIQQRLKHLGGQLEIDSAPGRGTRITIVGPLPPASRPEIRKREEQGQIVDQGHKFAGEGKIRVVIADDHHIVRQGLVSMVRLEPDIEIVGEAANGAQAVTLAQSLRPDIVVMDVSMPVLNGIEATLEIRRDFPEIQIIGLSMHEEGEISSAIREAGAAAYVTKGGPPDALIKAIRRVAANRMVIQ